jgi:UDP-N-acetylglucosamine diphosphorylase/glucosamine-1-phosphate N-acetyltransferase
LVNARSVRLAAIQNPKRDTIAFDESGSLSLAYIRKPGLAPQHVSDNTQQWTHLLALPQALPPARLATSLWDLIHWNAELLTEDFARLKAPCSPKPTGPHYFINPDQISLAPDAKLSPGCVLDATKGPITIGSGASIGANAVLMGPCWIGPAARIRPLTQIREGTTVGAGCTIGGEVSNTIFMSQSNKGHEGFIGHSYIGKWANLGSGTTTSNLKNTYGEIHARVGSREIPTGRQFLGSVIADHAKTAILTRLMAGTYVGFCSMIALSGIAPRMIPSFTFLTDKGAKPYQMDKAIEVTKRVFARRDRQFDETDRQLMRYVEEAAPRIER